MTLKTLERTPQRLVLQHEAASGLGLVCIAVGVNFLATTLFIQLQRFYQADATALFLAVAVSWLLAHGLLPKQKRENGSEYWFVVVFGAIPFLGVSLLSIAAVALLGHELRFPPQVTLTFDSRQNQVVLQRRRFFGVSVRRYSLDEIVDATYSIEQVYTGSMTITEVPTLQLVRARRRNGKRFQEFTGVSGSSESMGEAARLISQFVSRQRELQGQ